MIDCKFKSVLVGEVVHLNTDPMYCYTCNWQDKYSGKATYMGHGELNGIDYDVFSIEFHCPECGKEIKFYIEPCKSIVFTLELPLKLEIGAND